MAAREGRQSLEDLLAERQHAAAPVALPDLAEPAPPPPAPRPVRATPEPPGPAAARPSLPHRVSPRGAAERVRQAQESARLDPRSWEPFSIRLPEALVQRLVERIAADQQATGDYNLARNHYLEAALAAVPDGTKEAAKWGFAWRERPGSRPAHSAPTGSRISMGTAAAMHLLRGKLDTLPRRPKVWEVQAEALARLLDGLDETPPST